MSRDPADRRGTRTTPTSYVGRHRAAVPGVSPTTVPGLVPAVPAVPVRRAGRVPVRRAGRARAAASTGRRGRRGTALVASVLAMAGSIVVVTAATTTVAASAAVGPAFDCTSARFFLSQTSSKATQLYQLSQTSAGQVTKSTIGLPSDPSYNSLAYDPVDNYLYANVNGANGPTLGRIDSSGAVTEIAPFTATGTNNPGGGVSATFDPAGHYWIGGVGSTHIEQVDPATAVTLRSVDIAGGAALGGSDMSWDFGYIWSVQDNGTAVRRIDPTTGATTLVPIPGFSSSEPQGADWTYGNGNLGTSGNQTGQITQIQLTNPTSANPTAGVVNTVAGPSSGGNDGASCAPANVPMGITKTAPASVNGGAQIQWTITVTNQSAASDSSGYFFTDSVPANVTGVSTLPSFCTPRTVAPGATFSCNGDVLGHGQSRVFTFTADAPNTGGATVTNTVHLTADEANSCDTAPTAGCTTTATAVTTTPSPNLTIGKTGPATVGVGGVITWQVTVTNTGTGPSTGSTVLDALPTDPDGTPVTGFAATVDQTGQACTVTATGLSCPGPALARNAQYTITLTATAPRTYQTCVTNTATVRDTTFAGAPTVTSNAVQTCTPGGTLALRKVASVSTTQPGSLVTYTVTATDTGNGTWTAAHPATFADDLSDVLDDATYVAGSATASVGAATVAVPDPVHGAGDTLTWTGVPSGTTPVTVTYQVRVKDPDTDGNGTMLNTVASPFDPGCAPADCRNSITVAELVVTKSVSTTDTTPGSTLVYTVNVSNPGDGDWPAGTPAGVTDDLSDVLLDAAYNGDAAIAANPAGATAAQITTGPAGFSWTGPLPAHTAFSITYSVTLHDPTTGPDHDLTNTVTAAHSACAAAGTPACTTVTHVADLVAVKTSTAGSAQPGQVVPYSIVVTNTGTAPWPATTTLVSDNLDQVLDDATYNGDAVVTLPGGATTTTGIAAPTGPTAPASILSYTAALGAGQTVSLMYSVTVQAPDTGDHTLTNGVQTPAGGCGPHGSPADCPPVTQLVRDLATLKVASTQSAAPGRPVTYTITLTDTGSAAWPAATQLFTDDLSGVLDDATLTAGPTAVNPDDPAAATVSPAGVLSYRAALGVGHTATISYTVTVNQPDTGDHRLTNTVVPAVGCPAGDPDCTPPPVDVPDLRVVKTADTANASEGSTVTYTVTATNTGTADWTAAQPATLDDDLTNVLDDASLTGAVAVGGAPEATATPADTTSVPGHIRWSGALDAGHTVTFTYAVVVNTPDTGDHVMPNTVITPGNCTPASTDPACTATVRNADLAVTKVASTTNTSEGSVVTYTITATNTGQGDWTATNPAVVTDDLSRVTDDATPAAVGAPGGPVATGAPEAVVTQPAYLDPQRSALRWAGALAAGHTVVVTYSVTVQTPDTGDHVLLNTVVAPGNCRAGGTGCATTTNVADLLVSKSADTQDAAPGTVVHYTLTATNTGAGDWTAGDPATLADDLTQVLDDAAYNGDAAATGTTVTPAYTAPALTWAGPLAAGASVTITYSITVDAPDTGDHRLLNAVTAPGNCRTGSTDPACSTDTDVPDLTVGKTASTQAVQPGAVVTYTVTATNTGAGDWTATHPATLSDSLVGVLDDATYGNDATLTGDSTTQPTYAAPTISWSGALVHGGTVTITYSVTVDSPDTGDHVLPNTVVGPPGTGCAAGSTDPACGTTTGVADLAVLKTSSTHDVAPGRTVEYTITATSDGTAPWTAAYAPITDDLTGVLDDATYNADATATATAGTAAAPTYTAPVLSWNGDLAVGATLTITYSVTLHDPDTGDHDLPNGIGQVGNCADPTAPGCATDTRVADLTVTKTADVADPVPGSTVTYTLTAVNSGKGDWTATDPATLSDDLSGLLDDATYNGDAAATGTTVVPAYTAPTLTWAGPLAAGSTVTITYSVTVNSPDTGDHDLPNTVVSAIGDCEAGATNAACSVDPRVPDLAVVKTASATAADPGHTVTYTLVVTNTGAGDWTAADPAVATDDLTRVLDDATYNGDAAVAGALGTVTYAEPTLTWTGPLAAGAAVTITYSVTVDQDDTGDHRLRNTVTTPVGTCTDPSAPGCSTDTPVSSYTVVKTSDPASGATVQPGQVVHYRLEIANTGQVDLRPVVTDDLTKALDDAAWGADAAAPSGTLRYRAPTLQWTGPLPVGATVAVTYSVRVNDPDTGDGRLVNVVTGDGPLTNCVTDPDSCGTSSIVNGPPPVPGSSTPGTLSSTAAVDTQHGLLIAGLLLLLGLGLLLLGRGGSGGGRHRAPRRPAGPQRPSGGVRRRVVPALLVLVLGAALVGCTGGSSGHPGSRGSGTASARPARAGTAGGTARVTVAGRTAALTVSSCAASRSVVQVVAQAGATWTAQLRQDIATHSTFLVLVHHLGSAVQTFQASADASHPSGIRPTRISLTRRGASFSVRAVLASARSGTGQQGPSVRPGRFDVTCTHPG